MVRSARDWSATLALSSVLQINGRSRHATDWNGSHRHTLPAMIVSQECAAAPGDHDRPKEGQLSCVRPLMPVQWPGMRRQQLALISNSTAYIDP